MRRLPILVALTLMSSSAWAGDIMRDLSSLQPIETGVARLKPEFLTGGYRADLPADQLRERLTSLGYEVEATEGEAIEVTLGDRSLTIPASLFSIRGKLVSSDGVTVETVTASFLPGDAGSFRLGRHVEFNYRAGQEKVKRAETEAIFKERFGTAMKTVETKLGDQLVEGGENSISVAGLFCFDRNAQPITDPEACNLTQSLVDGYSYAIEVNGNGDVLAFDVSYANMSYYKAYTDAIKAKMLALLKDNLVAEYHSPRVDP